MDLVRSVDYHLEPGYVYASRQGAVVSTIVANGVAVSLWDKVQGYGGMAHFIYPSARHRDEATPRFGNAAMVALIQLMDEMGCARPDLVAQIFGGASPDSTKSSTLGEQSVRVVHQLLERKGIAVVSEDIGGAMGRKILFDTATGRSAVMKVHALRATDWYDEH